jgi:ubiquinone/menaquinone biosynthesis C-methylase UbiE
MVTSWKSVRFHDTRRSFSQGKKLGDIQLTANVRRNEPQDPYADFAERYDLLFGKFGEHDPARVAFFGSLFEKAGVQTVLDCACGTGRDLQMLHDAGYEMCGSDISAAMLNTARANLASCDVNVPLTRADFRSPPFRDSQFDAVLCLTTSLPHLLDQAEVLVALRSMRTLLRDGGILVLSQGLTDKLFKERPRFIPETNTPEFSRVFAFDYFEQTVHIHILDLFHEKDRQEFRVGLFEYLILLQDDYERLLTESRYRDVEYYGSFSLDAYDKEQSDQLIVVAHK